MAVLYVTTLDMTLEYVIGIVKSNHDEQKTTVKNINEI